MPFTLTLSKSPSSSTSCSTTRKSATSSTRSRPKSSSSLAGSLQSARPSSTPSEMNFASEIICRSSSISRSQIAGSSGRKASSMGESYSRTACARRFILLCAGPRESPRIDFGDGHRRNAGASRVKSIHVASRVLFWPTQRSNRPRMVSGVDKTSERCGEQAELHVVITWRSANLSPKSSVRSCARRPVAKAEAGCFVRSERSYQDRIVV